MEENILKKYGDRIINGDKISIIQYLFEGEMVKYLYPTNESKYKIEIKILNIVDKELRKQKIEHYNKYRELVKKRQELSKRKLEIKNKK